MHMLSRPVVATESWAGSARISTVIPGQRIIRDGSITHKDALLQRTPEPLESTGHQIAEEYDDV
jgi:hypothetical protein